MKPTTALALALVVTGALVACGDPSDPAPADQPLSGTSWTLTAFVQDGEVDPVPVPGRITATADFDDAQVSGSGGCNSFSGPYEISDDSIDIGPLASTLIGCPGERADVEAAYLKALDDAERFAIEGDALTLSAADGTVLLTFGRAVDATLEGTSWVASGINNGSDAVSSLVADTEATAEFTPDGTVQGSAGCNTYRGPFTLDGDSIAIGALTTTERGCEPDVTEQETSFLAALGRATTYEIARDTLRLTDDDGALQVAFTARDAD